MNKKDSPNPRYGEISTDTPTQSSPLSSSAAKNSPSSSESSPMVQIRRGSDFKAQKARAVVQRIKDGETPREAAKAEGTTLDAILADRRLNGMIAGAIQNFYVDDAEAGALRRATLADIMVNGEDDKSRVAAAKEIREELRPREGPKVGFQINIGPEVQGTLKTLDIEPED